MKRSQTTPNMKKNKHINNKGQVTLFVIIAILVVVGIFGALFFLGGKEVIQTKEVSPETFIQQCIGDAVQKTLPTILTNGGMIQPEKTIMYQGQPRNYLCYTADYYVPCYNRQPQLEQTTEEELKNYLRPDINNCFNIAQEQIEDQGYHMTMGTLNYDVNLLPGIIQIDINRQISIQDDAGSRTFERFSISEPTKLYDLIKISREIVNAETQFCNFEYVGYMLLHPEYSIQRTNYDKSKLYDITERQSNETLQFAIRSCAQRDGI